MKSKTALLAGASVLAMTAHAHADPIFTPLTFLLFAGPLGAIATPNLIYAGLQLATTVGLAALSSALRPRQPRINPQDVKQTTKGAEGPGRYAFGRVRLAGKVAFGDTAEYDIYRMILNCFGPVSLIEEYYYDGLLVDVDVDGKVISPPWITSEGTSNLYIEAKPGSGDETAWPGLMEDFPGKWTADHRACGLAQILLHAINPGTASSRFANLFQGGIKPVEIKCWAGSFYDPRAEVTQWSMNGVLHCLHWFRQLPGITDDVIDFASIGAVATEAEAGVATLTGTVPRCQLSGGWEGPLTYDIVLDMLESAGLELRETAEGKFTFSFIEDDPESELTLYSRHIIDREIYTGDEAAKRANICTLKFFSPERQFEIADIALHERNADTNLYLGAGWSRIDEEIAIYGEHEDPITLTFCCDASQAQRTARRLFHMRRADKMVLRTNFAGIAAWGKNTITVEIPDVGEDGESIFVKCRKIAPVRVNDSEGTCEIALAIISDILKTPWNPAQDEVAAPPVLEVSRYQTPFAEPARPSLATVVQYPDGKQEVRVVLTAVTGAVSALARISYWGFVQTGENQSGVPSGYYAWGPPADIDTLGVTLGYEKADAAGATYTGKQVLFTCGFYDEDDKFSGWSRGLEVAGLSIDNTKPSAPFVAATGTNGDWDVEVTIPNQPRIAWMRIEKNVASAGWVEHSTHDVRPSETIEANVTDSVSSGQSIQIRAYCFTSNDTNSNPSNVFSHAEP